MRVVIVDDEHLARERMRDLLEEHAGIEIAGEAATALDAIRLIETEQPDLVLLDIALQSMTAFDVLSALELPTLPLVIFTTAYDQYAVRAFEVQAIDYLLKPVERPRLAEALRRARSQLAAAPRRLADEQLRSVMESTQRSLPRILVRDGERIILLRVPEIDSVTAVGNYVRLQRGAERFLVRNTLASMQLFGHRVCHSHVAHELEQEMAWANHRFALWS